MGEIVSIGKLVKIIRNFKKQDRKIVLAGGCFDILHPGHVIFLQKARKAGDILVVFLESDQKVKKLKGINRPVLGQKERAKVLSALQAVDYVVLLPFLKTNLDYDQLISRIRPDVIATTSGDENISYHQRSAKRVGAKLKAVTKIIGGYSTSKILNY